MKLQRWMRMLVLFLVLTALLLTPFTALATTGEEIAAYASSEEFQGIRYRKNGATTKGFDCSGFVMFVYANFDIDLPHSTKQLKKLGTSVEKEDLLPGDLVFFRNWRHVGIFLKDGTFVHASSGNKRVLISSLEEGYYCQKYSGARRVLS